METRRDPRQFLFFIILLLLINSPETQNPGYNTRTRYDEVLEREWQHLDILNQTRWGDFGQFGKEGEGYLNVTGLREEDGFVWDILGGVKERVRERSKGVLGEEEMGRFLKGTDDEEVIEKPRVYKNLTGYAQGEWVRSPLSRIRHPVDLNVSHVLPDNPFPFAEFDRNLTGVGGPVRLHLTELEGKARTDTNRSISEIQAKVVIGDHESWGENWWEFLAHGVHYPEYGVAILTTTSERFAGVFALPHMQLSSHLYSSAQKLLNRTLHETMDRQVGRMYPVWNPWTSSVEGTNDGALGATHCEVVLFLQEFPVALENKPGGQQSLPGYSLDWLEHELRYPTGGRIPRRSPLTMSMVAFSPDCGFVIESKGPPEHSPSEATHLTGSKTEEFNDRARHGILAFAVTLSLQLWFLIRQAKEAATPSTRNRISFYTVAVMALGDGFAFLSLVFMHLFLGTSQLQLYTIAFLALFSVVLELRFLMDIWTVQVTEQMRQDRQQASTPTPPSPQPPATPNPQPRAPPPPSPTAPPPRSTTLPLPATANRPARPPTPIIIPSDQDFAADDIPTPTNPTTTPAATTPARAELGALYSRYCLFLIILFFITLQFTTMRSTARAIYFNTIIFLYLSFWVPQIYRNIMRNCRKALRWDFVVGQSVVRMVPIAYFYGVEDNVLFSRTDWRALAVLAGWMWLQIVALKSQEVLGSRFFVREGWAWVPVAYDYHPILREDEEGATMPIGSSTAPDSPTETTSLQPGESKGKGRKVFDCSICAQDIEVPVIPSGGGAVDGAQGGGLGSLMLQRRGYMVTPCRHIFHTPCLEGWMRYRLMCPNCREVLPPL
ncbi:hypothetical protein P280DRAFT_466553 [Massarina eburnea CBS 473.64]|uniref:DSC E3 ubiquitin ligase complex subunit A n=1 Tax=Massarina eburnea CBS 473.64 TaxID=1395130 RepID=A0A6A6S9B0_9PLEO|nr:hypothetical protein P280DRAFT_466553 [Massarina eburnea CBS 473.64]